MQNNLFVAAIIISILLFLCILTFVMQKHRLYKMKRRMAYYYGKDREIEYSDEVLSVISQYTSAKEVMLDDITWNDLGLDSIFMEIDHTWSFAGEDFLYYLLHIPADSHEKWDEADELITYYQTHEDERIKMQMEFAQIGKNHTSSVYAYITDSIHMNNKVPFRNWAAFLLLLFSLIITIVDPAQGVPLLILCMPLNIGLYFYKRKGLESSLQALQYFLKLQKGAFRIVKRRLIPTEKYQKRLEEDYHILKKKIGAVALLPPTDLGNQSLTELVLDYLRMITHVDCIIFYKCMSRLEKSIDSVENIITTLGFLESMISIGSLRESLPYYCVPKFCKGQGLTVTEAYHPALSEPVCNSIQADRGVLLTGSNASGKSTFLKTLALNAVLAQSLHTCPAKAYTGDWYRIFSSMALRDNLYKGESYYIAEIRSLKRIFDYDGEDAVLCFVDEVLRGTNTVERIAASAQVLGKFAERNILCFAASHDIELTYLLEKDYENYHFQEQVLEQEIVFDYLLREGRSNSRNAIRLLEILGYDPEITRGAEEMVEGFLETGKWKMVPLTSS